MPSAARNSFDANVEDVERLLAIHGQVGGTAKGRRYNLEVLNKSAVVLITAYWEAYCEDIAAEAIEHILKHSKSAAALPEGLKKQLAKEVKEEKHELAVWELADKGWKAYLRKRLAKFQELRNKNLNTPKTEQIDRLFAEAIGIQKLSNSWKWRKMPVAKAAKKLDTYVTLRGDIAHRGKHVKTVRKSDVEDFFKFVSQLAAKTGGTVNTHIRSVTGKHLWK